MNRAIRPRKQIRAPQFSNTVKEVREETGLIVRAERVIAVQDWRRHNAVNYLYGVIKIFVYCVCEGGEFCENIETSEMGYFDRDALPKNLAIEKTTAEQIGMCFDFLENTDAPPLFD